MPADSEEDEDDGALAIERVRESARDLGLGGDMKVQEKRPRGPQGEVVERWAAGDLCSPRSSSSHEPLCAQERLPRLS